MIIRHETQTGHTITETWYGDRGQKFIEVKEYNRSDELIAHEITLASYDEIV